jgi:hypothetical protein
VSDYIKCALDFPGKKANLHPAIQTVDHPTALLAAFGSRKATIDGYSTVLAACL